MARPAYGGRTTCESCTSIDVRRWHREGRLQAGQYFSQSWSLGAELARISGSRSRKSQSRCTGKPIIASVACMMPLKNGQPSV
jgi:hypothetical protein